MKWYVLQVLMGQELAVRDAMLDLGFCAKVPREIALIHRRGRWTEKEKILMPGYTFIGCGTPDGDGITDKAYHCIKNVPGVIRVLGAPQPQALAAAEADMWLAGPDEAIPPSTVRRSDGKVMAGPLLEMEGRIIKIDHHRRRARVKVPFLGGEYKSIEFSIRLEDSHGIAVQATEETAEGLPGPAG